MESKPAPMPHHQTKSFSRFFAVFDLCLYVLTGFLVVVLLATITAGIIFRAFNEPLAWTDELSSFLMVWLACLGWMIATRRGVHIRIQLVQNALPNSAWRGVEIISQLAVAFVGAVLAWQGLHLMQVNSDIEALSLPITVAWMYVPLLPAGLLSLLQAGADMCQARPKADSHEEKSW